MAYLYISGKRSSFEHGMRVLVEGDMFSVEKVGFDGQRKGTQRMGERGS